MKKKYQVFISSTYEDLKAERKKVQEIFEESGALEYANKMMDNMFYKAKTDIARLQIDSTIFVVLLRDFSSVGSAKRLPAPLSGF